MKKLDKVRCFANGPEQKLYADYHDNEWGVPLHGDRALFEMLILEGAQAGLSWETVLKKREAYRTLFHNFAIKRLASISDDELEACLKNPLIIRNRLKVFSVRTNARVALQIAKEFGSFDSYIWSFVKNTPIINHWQKMSDIPATSAESMMLAKDLKKRGMTFVGPTIIYAFMQAVGMVNDHISQCWCYGLKRQIRS